VKGSNVPPSSRLRRGGESQKIDIVDAFYTWYFGSDFVDYSLYTFPNEFINILYMKPPIPDKASSKQALILLSDRQLEKVSSILADLGILFIGSLVLPVLIGQSNYSIVSILVGITLSSLIWGMSVLLVK